MLARRASPPGAAVSGGLGALFSMRTSPMSSASGGRRPKKKVYYREPELDRVMELQKKPSLLLRLRSIIVSSKHQSIFLRDLEKELGFVQKWNALSLIQRHPSVFKISGGAASRSPISVSLTSRAQRISAEEPRYREMMVPVLINSLRKLLMMSMDCRIPMEKIKLIQSDLGLPNDFENSIIRNYPQFFSIKDENGSEHLFLESWDPSLAVTAREERLGSSAEFKNSKLLPRDGNFNGPFAFQLKYASGFRPNKDFLVEVRKWQKMAFPSPYVNARRVDAKTPQARKRAVAVLHEVLSLMMAKRLTSDKLDAFHNEYQLPCRLILCLIKNHGMFYLTNIGAQSTVILKDAYQGSCVIDKCPLSRFNDQFISLIGRQCDEIPASLLLG